MAETLLCGWKNGMKVLSNLQVEIWEQVEEYQDGRYPIFLDRWNTCSIPPVD